MKRLEEVNDTRSKKGMKNTKEKKSSKEKKAFVGNEDRCFVNIKPLLEIAASFVSVCGTR
jgi:hypothetical protein